MNTIAYAIDGPDIGGKDKFHLWKLQRREVGNEDVLIKILYCGICHSDIHTAKSEWGKSKYPLVPGHEIVGIVTKIGSNVNKFKIGDYAGVGCFIDSCRLCPECKNDEEHFCRKGCTLTYNSFEQDRTTPTYGGYSNQIVVKERYVLNIPKNFKNLAGVAPLLCAGITTYSPLHYYKDKVFGKKVGVVGLGGLGHMAVKFAKVMGAEVTVFSTSENKREDAFKLGAKHFILSNNQEEMKKQRGIYSLIINTISSHHDFTPFTTALEIRGIMVFVGISSDPLKLPLFSIVSGNKMIAGSMIGGIKETQEMINFCSENGIESEIELISFDRIDEAYERTIKSDVKYRFVLDTSTLR